jgi:SAM-dependent methyltransferase
MDAIASDHSFAGSIPRIYDTHFVPLLFAPYAEDLARRLAARPLSRVLEVAAGTGAATRALIRALPAHVEIVATDLNQAMLDHAAATGTPRPVEWRQADAMQLPFPEAAFDAVVCQFGAMFFPDKARAFGEMHRVLRPGGLFLFNVWTGIEENELADTVTAALASVFPDDPPRFMARTPHGYHDAGVIARDLAGGGFTTAPRFETIEKRSRAATPQIVAMAFCQGTPLRNEIERRDASRLSEATTVAESFIAKRFGPGPIDARMSATVVAVPR